MRMMRYRSTRASRNRVGRRLAGGARRFPYLGRRRWPCAPIPCLTLGLALPLLCAACTTPAYTPPPAVAIPQSAARVSQAQQNCPGIHDPGPGRRQERDGLGRRLRAGGRQLAHPRQHARPAAADLYDAAARRDPGGRGPGRRGLAAARPARLPRIHRADHRRHHAEARRRREATTSPTAAGASSKTRRACRSKSMSCRSRSIPRPAISTTPGSTGRLSPSPGRSSSSAASIISITTTTASTATRSTAGPAGITERRALRRPPRCCARRHGRW